MPDEPRPEQPSEPDSGEASRAVARRGIARGLVGPLWTALAALVFGVGVWPMLVPLVDADPSAYALKQDRPQVQGEWDDAHWVRTTRADLRFVTWQVARNANTLVSAPGELFQGEMCAPADDTLAFGPSGFTIGLLGVPFWLLTGDPVLTFNAVLFALFLGTAALIFWLVRDWTGLPAAGIVAATVFTFHYIKAGDIVHLYVRDVLGTVLALFFARRLFERARWGDAAGLAAAGVLLLGGSVYPMLAAALIAPFFLAWAIRHFGLATTLWPKLALIGSVVGLAALALLGPYLRLEAAGDLGVAQVRFFIPHYLLVPGRPGFPGFTALLLILLAAALPAARAQAPGRPNPRWVLFGSILLLASISIVAMPLDDLNIAVTTRDGTRAPLFPNAFQLLEALLPGLSLGRGPAAVYITVHLLLALIAGLGTAALLRTVPARLAVPVALALVALTSVESMRPEWLGFRPWYRYEPIEIRPPESLLAAYASIGERVGPGAILEIPDATTSVERTAQNILLTAYHGRRTSACYSPYRPGPSAEVRRLALDLPGSNESLDALADLGFVAMVVHHDEGGHGARSRMRRFARWANAGAKDRLELVAGDETFSAYLLTRGPAS